MAPTTVKWPSTVMDNRTGLHTPLGTAPFEHTTLGMSFQVRKSATTIYYRHLIDHVLYFFNSLPLDDTYRIFYKFVFETLVDVDDQSDQDLQNGGNEKVLVDLRSIVP